VTELTVLLLAWLASLLVRRRGGLAALALVVLTGRCNPARAAAAVAAAVLLQLLSLLRFMPGAEMQPCSSVLAEAEPRCTTAAAVASSAESHAQCLGECLCSSELGIKLSLAAATSLCVW
jgi:hypothetical protein